ncbi:MAG: CBS domain-containing protein [Gammaproteobacteria bacterium]|nr:CBS domain-containing protein [Gammaproteobacteria bacterium]MDH5304069.1 CBS domain-containing protein [Gammaproteobacteria bacterium]MDH5323495.1 CBS domain-containing protein [Gammaproteobacteria bacterium]
MFSIESIMSTELITIRPRDSLAKARALMQKHRIHHLPVVDGAGALVGLLTISDLLAATDSVLRDDKDRIDANEICINDVMVTDLATIDEQTDLRQAALFLEKHRIGCLPVVSKGVLKGIVTDTDFVAVAINLLEQLDETEPDDDLEAFDEQYA